MDQDPGLVCYRHCKAGLVVALRPPAACVLCGAALGTAAALDDAPYRYVSCDDKLYRLPFPLRRASQSPCALVIKPTRGDFLHDYESGDDLHIGVTDSEGCVYAFSSEGLQSDSGSSFAACLVVGVLDDAEDPVWQEYWNTALSTTIAAHRWSEESYDETERNCYSFVIEFLKTLQPPALQHFHLTKLSFCSSFVVPHASAAARYIALYRAVERDGCVALRSPDATVPGLSSNGSANGRYRDPEGQRSNSYNQRGTSAEERLPTLSSGLECGNGSNYRPRSLMNHWSSIMPSPSSKGAGQHPQPQCDPGSDIENRVSQVIEDLLESQRVEHSRRYLTHYAEDIRRDLRSVVPPKPRDPKSFISQARAFISHKPDSHLESFSTLISNFEVNTSVSRTQPLSDVPSLSSKISMFTSAPSGPPPGPPGRLLPSLLPAPHATADEAPPLRSSVRTPKRAEHISNSSGTRTDTTLDAAPVLRGRVPLSKPRPFSSGQEARVISLQVKSAVKTLSIEIYDDGDKSQRLDANNLSNIRDDSDESQKLIDTNLSKIFDNANESYKLNDTDLPKRSDGYEISREPNITAFAKNDNSTTTDQHENLTSVEINSENVNSSYANKTVKYNDWVADGGPAELTTDEFVSSVVPAVLAASKWSNAVLSRRVAPEKEMHTRNSLSDSPIAQSHIKTKIVSHENTSDVFPLEGRSSRGSELAQRSEPVGIQVHTYTSALTGSQRQSDSDACRQVVELCSRFEPPSFSSFGKDHPLTGVRRPLRREKTWRYGQEPCPQNYEGKLMGKLDVSTGFNWETKGCPSTLSMPGYIYEDGVLPETRC